MSENKSSSGRSKAIFSLGAIGAWIAGKFAEQAGEFLSLAFVSRVLIAVLLWWLGTKFLGRKIQPMVPALATQGVEVVQFILILLAGQAEPSAVVFGAILCAALVWLAIRPGPAIVGFLILIQLTGIGFNVWQMFQPNILQEHSEGLGYIKLSAVISQSLLRLMSIGLLLNGLAEFRRQHQVKSAAATA